MPGNRCDFFLVIAQPGMQALQHRMGVAVIQALAEDAVHAPAQFGFVNVKLA